MGDLHGGIDALVSVLDETELGTLLGTPKQVVVKELFLAEAGCLPCEWAMPPVMLPSAGEAERARIVADYLAGMTDRFALDEHRRLFDPYAPV